MVVTPRTSPWPMTGHLAHLSSWKEPPNYYYYFKLHILILATFMYVHVCRSYPRWSDDTCPTLPSLGMGRRGEILVQASSMSAKGGAVLRPTTTSRPPPAGSWIIRDHLDTELAVVSSSAGDVETPSKLDAQRARGSARRSSWGAIIPSRCSSKPPAVQRTPSMQQSEGSMSLDRWIRNRDSLSAPGLPWALQTPILHIYARGHDDHRVRRINK